MNLGKILNMFVPAEDVVVLQLLLISQIQQVIIELCENVEVSESQMVPHEKRSALQILLQMLS